MSLQIFHKGLKHFNNESFTPAAQEKADCVGWALLGIGMTAITAENVDRVLFRMKMKDRAYGSNFIRVKKSDAMQYALTTKELRAVIVDHIGLTINMTQFNIKLTEKKFLLKCAEEMADSVGYKIDKELN